MVFIYPPYHLNIVSSRLKMAQLWAYLDKAKIETSALADDRQLIHCYTTVIPIVKNN